MAEEHSFIFDFSRVDDFFENFNQTFFIEEMWKVTGINSSTGEYTYAETGSDCFQLVLASYGGDNISDYLDEYGGLSSNVTVAVDEDGNELIEDISLDWYNRGNGEATIELHSDVTFDIGDINTPIKAVLLRSKESGYIMGYSINMVSFTVTNQIKFDNDVIFWDIRRLNTNE